MSHDTHTLSGENKDLKHYSREDYLEMAREWTDPFDLPTVYAYDLGDGRKINVVRDDLIEIGSKGRFGDLLISKMESDTLVYVAPRVGYAGMSLAYLAKKYNKRLILFAPACKQASAHQTRAYELGADMVFARIAAMPNLNKLAKDYAERTNAQFVPFGLAHPLVTAAIVDTANRLAGAYGEPKRFWSVISTGVLSRGLQIGWPSASVETVAVARNIKDGEKGRASIYSHPLAFTDPTRVLPPFPSVETYDAKAWEYILQHAQDGDWFWNVAAELKTPPDLKTIPSSVSSAPWGVIDFEKHAMLHSRTRS